MKTDKNTRSQHYQYKFFEIDTGDNFQYIADSFGHSFNDPINGNIEIRLLKEQLYDRMIELAKEKLTKKQYRIFELTIQGYDQKEVSKMVGVNQSTICHTLNGVKQNYKNIKGEIKIYYCSGVYLKLKRIASEDIQIQNILKQIQDSMDNYILY